METSITADRGDAPDYGGIRRVELPLPFQPGSVNVYLVPQEDGWILMDCGMDLPAALPAYQAAGIDWRDIRQALLTHVHPDHSGLAAQIRELTGAPVRMHSREEDVLKSLSAPRQWLAWQEALLHDSGVPAAAREGIQNATSRLCKFFPSIAADSHIEDGEIIPTALGPMQALLTPGHSAGHLCFYFRDRKLLLAGDQLLKPRTPHLEWSAKGSALAEFRASLERLARLDVAWVLPSHGAAFTGHRARIESIDRHCAAMAARITELQSRGLESPHDLACAYWNRPMSPFEHRTAVFEMLAYLQHPN
jgi:glyoxylase-like metal-dependent hydrolase (beta-lactamase superfamily II)